MGTSQSSRGLGNNAPLVPPWAESPSSQTALVGDFRHALTAAVKGGGQGAIRSALGHYARSVTGGSRYALRRFNSAIQGGVGLYRLLSGEDVTLLNIKQLVGKPCDEVIAEIARALSKNNGDADRIHAATAQALSNALDGKGVFAEEMMTIDIIAATIVNYYTEIITNQIMQDSGKIFDKAETPAQMVEIENQLRQLVWVVVDKYMMPGLQNEYKAPSGAGIEDVEKKIFSEVWEEMEAY